MPQQASFGIFLCKCSTNKVSNKLSNKLPSLKWTTFSLRLCMTTCGSSLGISPRPVPLPATGSGGSWSRVAGLVLNTPSHCSHLKLFNWAINSKYLKMGMYHTHKSGTSRVTIYLLPRFSLSSWLMTPRPPGPQLELATCCFQPTPGVSYDQSRTHKSASAVVVQVSTTKSQRSSWQILCTSWMLCWTSESR